MNSATKPVVFGERGAALIIVLAFVVLLTGLTVAYMSRTTSDRQIAHGSFNQSNADQFVASAMDNIIGDLRQEIIDGSTPTTLNGVTTYSPTAAANVVPQRSGNPAGIPNLIRRSVRSDPIPSPGRGSRASAVNSTTDISANGRSVTSTRWNSHYLVPKKDTGTDDFVPIDVFSAATPDWVYVTPEEGATPAPAPSAVIGRYAYAIYDEGGLVDVNVAGYPTGTTPVQSGRKGSLAFSDLTALPTSTASPAPTFPPAQVDNIVGWRNYASTQPGGDFGSNFTFNAASAQSFYNLVINNSNGFLKVRTDPSPSPYPWNDRTDQMFLSRQELIVYRSSTQFSSNALQYFGTFSRETNSPSFSPATPTATNPNFVLARAPTTFTRFDGTTANVGEPLVKRRFPLSRLAWLTYKGPSASLLATDPVITALKNAGVSDSTIQAGTAASIKACFGLTFPVGGAAGSAWTYTNPTGTSAASTIMTLGQVAAASREPDFFELLQAAISNGSLGQNTGGGVTGSSQVFPDVHMSSTTHHVLSIGAAIIDQADPESIPTRVQFNPSGTAWTAYGVESLPYITQLYPIAGTSPDDSTKWATYFLFQVWNPHQNVAGSAPTVRLRVDGAIGIFTGGNSETWNAASTPNIIAAGQSIALKSTASFSTATPLTTDNTIGATGTTPPGAVGTFAALAAPAVPTPTPTPPPPPTPTPTP